MLAILTMIAHRGAFRGVVKEGRQSFAYAQAPPPAAFAAGHSIVRQSREIDLHNTMMMTHSVASPPMAPARSREVRISPPALASDCAPGPATRSFPAAWKVAPLSAL